MYSSGAVMEDGNITAALCPFCPSLEDAAEEKSKFVKQGDQNGITS